MKFKPQHLHNLRHLRSEYVPNIFVETGTWKGITTVMAANHFPTVHTIELSVVHHMRALDTFRGLPHVHCHYGDSAAVLPILCDLLPAQPVMFYLDAHWFKVDHAAKGRFPLWGELEAIAKRGQPDIVVVDDVHSFGTCNPEPAWERVSLDSICQCLRDAGRDLMPWGPCETDQVAAFLE